MTMLRLRKCDIDKLEAATNEVATNIPKNKQPLLAEIYKVAKAEERVHKREISMYSTTSVDCFANSNNFV
jgi:hypothetical protein